MAWPATGKRTKVFVSGIGLFIITGTLYSKVLYFWNLLYLHISKDTFPHPKVVVAYLLLVSQCQCCRGLAAAYAHHWAQGAFPGLFA